MAKTRDMKMDGLKFIMIFLAVLAHLGDYNDFGLKLNRIIYSFHMPIFIFLSGYFTSIKTSQERKFSWLKQTLTIYFLAQAAHVILEILLRYVVCRMKQLPFDYSFDLVNLLFSPRLALWYLICLLYWRLLVWGVYNKVNDWFLLSFSFVLALVSGVVPIDHTYSFQRAFAFFPFFILGVMFRERNWMRQLEKVPILYVVIGISIGLILARVLPMYMPKVHYENWQHLLVRFCHTLLGVYLCLLIVRISRIGELKIFSEYGAYTLWIYIGHTFLIVIGGYVFSYLNIKLNLFSAVVLSVLYCVIFVEMAKFYRLRVGKH